MALDTDGYQLQAQVILHSIILVNMGAGKGKNRRVKVHKESLQEWNFEIGQAVFFQLGDLVITGVVRSRGILRRGLDLQN